MCESLGPVHRPPAWLAALCLLCGSFAWPVHAADQPQRCIIGVGGEFPAGFDGLLARMGLPYEQILFHQLSDPNVLKNYDAVVISSPGIRSTEFTDGFLEYLRGGGRGLIEVWRQQRRDLFPGPWASESGRSNLKVVADHPALKYLTRGQVLGSWGFGCQTLLVDDSETVKVLMRYTNDPTPEGNAGRGTFGERGYPALLLVKVGAGEYFYAAHPLGYPVGWRHPHFEPLVRGIFEYLAGPKATPRFVGTRESEWPDWPQATPNEGNDQAVAVATVPLRLPLPGYEAARNPCSSSYNVSGTLLPLAETGPTRELLFDYRDAGNYSCVELHPQQIIIARTVNGRREQLCSGQLPSVPEAGTPFVLARRSRYVKLALSGNVVCEAKWASPTPGGVLFRSTLRHGRLRDVRVQRVEPPRFEDSFTREPGETASWEPLAGTWKATGIANAAYSVNGFTYMAQAESVGLARVGSWWWEDYTVSAAAMPKAETTAVGVCVAVNGIADYMALRLEPEPRGPGMCKLVRVTSTAEQVLASSRATCVKDQWVRLGVRRASGKLEGYVDGEKRLECADPTDGAGPVGLLVNNGPALFDDVDVRPSEECPDGPPACQGEGSAHPALPINVGPTDYMTWASRAVEWSAVPERPTLLWHRGGYFTDVILRLTIPAGTPADASRTLFFCRGYDPQNGLSLHLGTAKADGQRELRFARGSQTIGTRLVSLPKAGNVNLELSRRGQRIIARWGAEDVGQVSNDLQPYCAGVEVIGPPIRVADLVLETQELRDYCFASSPTDWWVSSGSWDVRPRWACDERWSWYSGQSDGVAAIWNKHRFEGDIVMDFYVGVRHKGPGGDEQVRQRDLNSVLCGDGKDVYSGYSFILGGADGVVTSILRNGQVVATDPVTRIPGEYAVHHQWQHIQVRKVGNVVSLLFEDRPSCRYEDPQPLSGGYVGLWTRNSAIMVARVSIYYERETPGALLGL